MSHAHRSWIDCSIHSGAPGSTTARCKSGNTNHGCNASHDLQKGDASEPLVTTKKEEIGGSGEIYADTGQMEVAVQKSEKQARLNRQAAGRQDHFGGAVLGAGAGGAAAPGRRVRPVTIDELEGCFDILATEATTGKTTLDELVKTNSTLNSSITELATANTRITKEAASLSQEMNKYKTGGQEING